MPVKRRATGAPSSPAKTRAKIDVSSRNTPAKSGKKPIVPKAKAAKKDIATQANTLFDFYPNLSKNAPLFRPSLHGDNPVAIERQSTDGGTSLATDDYEAAMKALDDDSSNIAGIMEKDPVSSNTLPQAAHPGESFGPFSLDDDDGALLEMHDLQPTSSDLDTSSSHRTASDTSDRLVDRSSASSADHEADEEQYVQSLSDQVGKYRDTQTDELDLPEDRDRFENADDEVNEDEAWSWQEYNAENFGKHESRDSSVLCPMCGLSIIGLSEHDRSAHVNRCLDLPAPSKEENQVDGKALIDATVVREREAEPPPIVKQESCHAEIKIKREDTEQSLPYIKPEPRDDDEIEDYPDIEVKDEFPEDDDDHRDSKDNIIVKEEIQDVKPSLAKGASNAFDKIMVGHSEEKQWADAARTENLQRGTKYKTRICPFYKILTPFPIAVDAFKYGTVPGIEGYYLTHFHSDHYGGLSSTWDAGPIYCSSITGSLVIQQLRVRPEYVVKLPMNVPTDVNGVQITLIDANHCPGSTLFLFEGQVRGRNLRYLHCGDFRATPTQLLHPSVRGKRIDCLYLDTTYLSPKYAFPSQEDVIEACAHVCRDLAGLLKADNNPVAEARNSSAISKFLNKKSADEMETSITEDGTEKRKKSRGRLLVVVGTYSIGKERIVVGIAKALGSKIFAAQRKRDILNCLEDEELSSLITADPLEAQVHMTYLQEIRAETLSDYLTQFHPHFSRIVGFRGTGWTYSPPKTRFLDSPSVEQIMAWNPRYSFRDMSPGRGSTGTAACYGVPYSEHSSFRELMCFCLSADLMRVIPTVNIGSEKSRKLMKAWIDKWALEVRKNGLRPIKPHATEWQ